MDPQRNIPDDLDIRIRWPTGYDDAPAADRPQRAAPGRPAGPPPAAGDRLAERIDRLGEALALVAEQVGQLSRQTAALRGIVEDRLGAGGGGPAPGSAPGALSVKAHRELLELATDEVIDAVAGNGEALVRIEQVTTVLSTEVAHAAGALSDQIVNLAEATTDEIHAGLARVGSDIEGVGESIADALAPVTQQLEALAATAAGLGGGAARPGPGGHPDGTGTAAASGRGVPVDPRSGTDVDSLVEATHVAVGRIETLVDALVEAMVEPGGDSTAGAPGHPVAGRLDQDRLDQLEGALTRLLDRHDPDAGNVAGLLAERFAAFSQQLDAVRRHLSVRARAVPVLDERALDHLADLLAERLDKAVVGSAAGPGGPPPRRPSRDRPIRAAGPPRPPALPPPPPDRVPEGTRPVNVVGVRGKGKPAASRRRREPPG
ncbi:MAG: hypothetical protein ACRDY0_00540 [Acidimicrobiales bacterium]